MKIAKEILRAFSVVGWPALLLVISAPLHEIGHWLAAWLVGCPGTIEMYWANLSGAFYNAQGLTGPETLFVGFMGGGLVVIIYGLLLAVGRGGEAFLAGLRCILAVQLFYAIGEALENTTVTYFLILGVLIAIAYSFPKVKYWYFSTEGGEA